MVEWSRVTGLVLLFGGILIAGPTPGLLAATSATSDILSGDRDVADTVDIGNLKPITKPNREAVKPVPVGNPLWSVPLSVLTATQERPIFSASRRPPQRAVVAPPVAQVVVAPPQPTEPERPPLALIGAVVSDSDAIAVFLDRSNQKIVRLRQGETLAGWVLSSVQRREVTLKKADQTEIIAFQRPDGSAGASGPASGGVDVSYAPFIPRSTPKNGAADGL